MSRSLRRSLCDRYGSASPPRIRSARPAMARRSSPSLRRGLVRLGRPLGDLAIDRDRREALEDFGHQVLEIAHLGGEPLLAEVHLLLERLALSRQVLGLDLEHRLLAGLLDALHG